MSSKSKKKVELKSVSKPQSAKSGVAQPRLAQPRNTQINWARAFLIVAIAMAGYLAWASLSGGSLAGCGPESGCDRVMQSRWAYWLGIPVSIPALLTYFGILAATFSARESAFAERQKLSWNVIIILSVTMTGAALWFIGLQLFVLKSFCPFCMTAHSSGLIAAAILLNNVPIQPANTKLKRPETAFAVNPAVRNKLALAGVFGVAILMAGQVLVTKQQRHQVRSVAASSARVETPKNEPRKLELHAGKFQLLLDEMPMMGSPAASNVMVSLFDYTCHHCRDMHGMLLEVQQRFSNHLAIVTLPMPLDANCNYLMTRTPSAHVNACEYARLGLAVWRADPKAFPQFDSWVFAPSPPLPVAAVKQYAEDLVGREKLEAALTNGWVKSQIQTDVAIYDANKRLMTNGSMPQLIVGQAISIGALNGVDQLFNLVAEHFGLKRAP
ncbi:MAG: hypothetical protein EXS30_07410 [Pedosphaera sp.]|nr:hypothetical protein [Pedosphaera sp.]